MVRLAIRELLGRRTATAVSAAGLLTAILGFLLIAGTARTTQATISGDVARSWATPYDLLIRPAGSKAALEERRGLIRPDFLQAVDGGITMAQLDAIRAEPGVKVAAPIALIGAIEWIVVARIDLSSFVEPGTFTVLRVRTTSAGDGGRSTYPAEPPDYLYVAPAGSLTQANDGAHLRVGKVDLNCSNLPRGIVGTVSCFGGRTPGTAMNLASPGSPGVAVLLPQPAIVAAIDPVAEAAITPLGECVTSGRMLDAADMAAPLAASSAAPGTVAFPAIVSDHSAIGETYHFSVDRLSDPKPVISGAALSPSGAWVSVGTLSTTADAAYRDSLDAVLAQGVQNSGFTPLWTIGDARYRPVSGSTVAVVGAPPDPLAYEIPTVVPPRPLPGAAQDVWFRSVLKHDPVPRLGDYSTWAPVGRFDPTCLPRLDTLIGSGGLDAYAVPDVILPDGSRLAPTRSVGSYVPSPPLLVTSLNAAAWYADPKHFSGAPGDAYISAIRIKVDGVDEPTPEAQARLVRIAKDIHTATGLTVDIVKGVSGQQVSVDLPAGDFGRPALTVTEDWSLKGVAIRFAKALAGQDLALFAIVLVVAAVLLAETAFLSVRRRRSEFGVLRALGWSAGRIAWLVELEMAVLGIAVGIIAGLVGVGVAVVTGSLALVGPLGLSIPLGLAVAALAGLVPAIAAARGSTIGVIRGGGRVRRSRPAHSISGFAVGDLLRSRHIEALLGIAAVGLGSALVGGIVLVSASFNGRLDTTVLGQYVGAQIEPFHVVLAILTTVIGTLAAAEVITLGYLERQADLAALRALGWSRRAIVTTLAAQAAAIGALGGLLGAAVTAAFGQLLGASVESTLGAGAVGVLIALGATLVATVGPLVHAYRSDPASALRGE